jgi:hypothetical protein
MVQSIRPKVTFVQQKKELQELFGNTIDERLGPFFLKKKGS